MNIHAFWDKQYQLPLCVTAPLFENNAMILYLNTHPFRFLCVMMRNVILKKKGFEKVMIKNGFESVMLLTLQLMLYPLQEKNNK